MDQVAFARQASLVHKAGQDEVDFKEFIDQVDEYEKALTERLQVFNEDTNEQKLSQIQQIVTKIGFLSKVGFQKGHEQVQNIMELNSTVQEQEQEMMKIRQSESLVQDEIRQLNQQIDQHKLEIQEAESRIQEKQDMFQVTSDTIQELRSVNSSLQLSMQASNKAEKTKQETEVNDNKQLTKMLNEKITELTTIIENKSKNEEKLNNKMTSQKASLEQWEKNSKTVYKELKRNEILQEKERYEMLLQIKQLKNKNTEYSKEMKLYEQQIKKLQLQEVTAQTKRQLANMHGSASFLSSQNVTPNRSAQMKGSASESPEMMNARGSIISQGENIVTDLKIGDGLLAVTEENENDNSLKMAGGLDIPENGDDGMNLRSCSNNELGDLEEANNELSNFENEFTSPTDDFMGNGDIINPMEAAQYYQGSFQADQNAFGQSASFAEYRSQESDDDDKLLQQTAVEVQEMDDDLPDDMKLRLRSMDPNAGQNSIVEPNLKMGLQIQVDDENGNNDNDECLMYPGKKQDQTSDAALQHYKNESQKLKQELMINRPDVPMTPNSGGNDAQRDPEEEFFMLAVLALKMLHNEHFEDAEYVYEVSAAKLFRQVRSENLPFHQWYKWLEKKFFDLRDAFKKQEQVEQEFAQWNQKQDDVEVTNKRRPDSTKKRATSFFNKLKKAVKGDKKEKKEKKDSEKTNQRVNVGSTPKKLDAEQLRIQQECSAEKALQTISESMQDRGQF